MTDDHDRPSLGRGLPPAAVPLPDVEAAQQAHERPRHDSTRVAAVVLTHDAPEALGRCLAALDAQVAPLGAVLVTDCASRFPLDEVARRFERVEVRRLPENLGPAGGYAEALTAFLDTGFEWAWVMDDDCVPVPDALARQLDVAAPDRVVLSTAQWAETCLLYTSPSPRDS